MAGEYNSKYRGKSTIKRAMKRTVRPPIYKAIFGGRAKVAPSQKYGRYSLKGRKFEQAIQLIKRQHEPGLSETERAASNNLALALCQRHGIELDEVLQEIEFRKNRYNGGFSTVIIKHRDHHKYQLVRRQTFLLDMVDAIEMLFDCCAFTEIRKGVMRVTFYGIGSNTVSAQLAFKMAYNDATQMGQSFRGNGPRNSYLLGVAAGLLDKAVYRKFTIEKEIEKARQIAATTFSTEDFSVDDNYEPDFDFDVGPLQEAAKATDDDQEKSSRDDGGGGEETGVDEGEGKENSADKGIEDEDEDDEEDEGKDEKELEREWVQMTLILADHRDKVEKAAATWLAGQGIKLRAARKGKKIIRDQAAFDEGKDDSNDLDLGEKKLCGTLMADIQSPEKNEAMDKDWDFN